MEKTNNNLVCHICGKPIKPGQERHAEFSETDGEFYYSVPKGHRSLGFFPVGKTCVSKIKDNKPIRMLDSRTILVVFKEHTLGYIIPTLPNTCQILHASALRGAVKTDGSILIINAKDVRLASAKDFEDYRVSFKGYDNEKEYLFKQTKND